MTTLKKLLKFVTKLQSCINVTIKKLILINYEYSSHYKKTALWVQLINSCIISKAKIINDCNIIYK